MCVCFCSVIFGYFMQLSIILLCPLLTRTPLTSPIYLIASSLEDDIVHVRAAEVCATLCFWVIGMQQFKSNISECSLIFCILMTVTGRPPHRKGQHALFFNLFHETNTWKGSAKLTMKVVYHFLMQNSKSIIHIPEPKTW